MAKKRKRNPEQGARARAAATKRRRRRRAGKRTLHYLLLLIFLVSAGVVLSLTVFFKIESVQVVGVDKYHPDAIIQTSGIQVGENLLRLKTKDIEAKILAEFPYIATVRVARRFPPKVELIVTQSVPEGAIIENGEVALITLEGKILERGDILVPTELPLIRGIPLGDKQPGAFLGQDPNPDPNGDAAYADNPENKEKLDMLIYLFDAAEKIDFGPITNVDVTNRLNMKMVYEARLVLELGSESDLEYKLNFLREVISTLAPDDQARLDATNARNKRVLVKWGKVENGIFTPVEDGRPEETILAADGEESPGEEGQAP